MKLIARLVAAMMAASVVPGTAAADAVGPDALTLFAARMADNDWVEIASLDDLGVRDAWLAGVAVSHEVAGSRRWALELEGQGVRHFGEEHHWEFNAALFARWRSFPWNQWLPTSVAFGIGPSYATRRPVEEVARDGDSARLLLYWAAELELGVPDTPWSALARLHHRSSAYGVFADRGGSNWLTLGVRRRF